MSVGTLIVDKVGSTGKLLRDLALDSGMMQWTDEQLRAVPVARLRVKLFLTSFLLLFFELVCIRWIPSHVRLLGFFMNFILLATFLGFGVGILSGRHKRLWLPSFPLMMFVLLAFVAFNRLELNMVSTQVLYYGAATSASNSEHFILLPLIFTLVALAVIPLARSLGRLLTALPPLQAYALDILGSLAGIATFALMSLFSLPPLVWFVVVILISLFLLKRSEIFLFFPLMIGALYFVVWLSGSSIWSPYYRISIEPNDKGGYVIGVNNVGHQETMYYQQKENFYFRVYDLLGQKPFKRVLVLGAGTGSDVAIALANGAEQVDAVEIDPVIYRLGQTLNPDKPYADPRVKMYIEDGRTFLRNTTQQYDLIVYALPDSLTLTSAYSSLRLESFLLTTESLQEARRRLGPDGLVVLYNYYREDFLVRKLAGMVEEVFQTPPFVTTYGDWGRAGVLMAGPRLADLPAEMQTGYRETDLIQLPGRGMQLPLVGQGFMEETTPAPHATDDWPFVYVPQKVIPNLYINALLMVLGIALVLLLLVAPRGTLRRFDWHFFFLGAAFMLLETRSLVTFGLLFGSTWMVNSMVFFAILSSVLLAILFNARFKIQKVWPLYVLLFTMLIINYLLPQKTLLGIQAPALRYTLASLLAFLPIFLANVIFSRSFRETETADIAFGSNTLGSMVGGVCEYVALASGYQSLLLFVIVFYLVAYFFWRRAVPVPAAS